jgi:methionyl-tRNA formyltransferase
MRLIFMGTPDFAVATLRALMDAGHDIVCVYSQPLRPAGRGYNLKPSPVHAFAGANKIIVHTPLNLKSVTEQSRFVALQADAAVVVAYGLLLPTAVLGAPKYGCFNVHASLLPRWRGAAPIQRAIMAGDRESGTSIMRMDQGLDTGPVVRTERVPITDETTASSLHDALKNIGADAMVEALKSPDFAGIPQPLSGVTYARKIDKDEAKINFADPAPAVLRHIHGISPFPGAWFTLNGTRIKVVKCRIFPDQGDPGTFLNDELAVACGSGSLQLLELQREGKSAMHAGDFLRGHPVPQGARAT